MEEHAGTEFIPLLLVLLLAFIVPLLLSRVHRIPIVVGEIIAGVLIGQSGFNLVAYNPALDGKRVRHLHLSGDLLIVSISRQGELLIPHGNMRVYHRDRMTVLGNLEALQKAQSLLEG